jgi:hypothetical protein
MNEFWVWANPYVLKYFFLFFIIFTLSSLEVQTEGKNGWNKNLPTWRIKSTIYTFIMGGKELTGYIFYMLIFIILFLHFPFFAGVEWTIAAELETIMIFFLFSVFWDFLWFVLNPFYGISKLKKKYVWWHKKWIGNIPFEYPLGIFVAFLVSLLDYPEGVIKWGLALGIFSVLTLIIVVINQLMRKDPKYKEKHLYYFKNK